jgi:transcriptional regulator with XRE-family HTH domain
VEQQSALRLDGKMVNIRFLPEQAFCRQSWGLHQHLPRFNHAQLEKCKFTNCPNLLLTKNVVAESCLSGYYPSTPGTKDQRAGSSMNIGETIRTYRLQKGMSQGDIEKRTGLLRCYLSRVENGHTIPSLDTLSKIAGAMELPLGQFFADHFSNGSTKHLPALTEDEVRFLTQIRRYSMGLNDSDRKLVLAMVKKMAAGAGK